MEKIIVTGATSMIGYALIDEALRHKETKIIYAVIRKNSPNRNRIPLDNRIKIIECDMAEYRTLPDKINDKCDVFFSIAWNGTGPNRDADIQKQALNISYYIDALRSAKKLGCNKFIGAGSQAEYGKLNLSKINELSPISPIQAYGISKYAAGKLCSIEAKKIDIDFFWVRIFSVYGKYDKSSTIISSSIKKLLKKEHMSFTKGEQLWDYLYSEDAGKAFYLIGDRSTGNKVYCLGSGLSKPLHEYIKELCFAIDPSVSPGIGELEYKNSTPMDLCADISLLQSDTGWNPIFDFHDGIRKTIAFIKKEENFDE